MSDTTKAEAGWVLPAFTSTRKFHYFTGEQSMCRAYGRDGTERVFTAHEAGQPNICRTCLKAKARLDLKAQEAGKIIWKPQSDNDARRAYAAWSTDKIFRVGSERFRMVRRIEEVRVRYELEPLKGGEG